MFMTERIMEEVCYGAAMQALRQRGVRQERADAWQAALLVQSLRPELHGHTCPRQAAGHESGCRAELCQWPVREAYGQSRPLYATKSLFECACRRDPYLISQ